MIFRHAVHRWQRIIVGDLPSASYAESLDTVRSVCGYNTTFPDDVAEDLDVCVRAEPIDEINLLIGAAGPVLVREDSGVPLFGFLTLDSIDIDNLRREGVLESVTVHLLGHTLGFGVLWDEAGIIPSNTAPSCNDYRGPSAIAEYQRLSGCVGAKPPVETDGSGQTPCNHWDEQCFQGELMTGYLNTSVALSRLSVASMEDLGYGVRYEGADPYDSSQLSPKCRCDGRRRATTTTTTTPLTKQKTNMRKRPLFAEDDNEEEEFQVPSSSASSNVPPRQKRQDKNKYKDYQNDAWNPPRALSENSKIKATAYGKSVLRNRQQKIKQHTLPPGVRMADTTVVVFQEDGFLHEVVVYV